MEAVATGRCGRYLTAMDLTTGRPLARPPAQVIATLGRQETELTTERRLTTNKFEFK